MESYSDKYDGLVFDFDGTLADSIPAHIKAWQDTFRQFNIHVTEEDILPYAGTSPLDICSAVAVNYNLDIDIEAVSEEKASRYLDYLDMVVLIEPVMEIVKNHYGKLPMAIATGNLKRVAEGTLESKKVLHFFDAVVSSKQLKHSKPAPDVFLEAARRIKVSPAACCAFEDSEMGILSAQSAGMDVINVRDLINNGR